MNNQASGEKLSGKWIAALVILFILLVTGILLYIRILVPLRHSKASSKIAFSPEINLVSKEVRYE